MRYLGLDWGEKRVGIAISDVEGKISTPLKVVSREALIKELFALREEFGEFEIVLGLPARTDGLPGASEKEVIKLKQELEELGFKVHLWKEWFSSVEAKRILDLCEVKGGRKKDSIDKISAALILESYLRSVSGK
ncbi:MAG: Holliday junction resolvase RuvX [Synergistetes bacterium]|nr:MAG: Putative Holliday junction resolvase [bacterium 42_11]MBC7331906.1 Holliday junction resolvase RuvX [Synergistota bacterium]MDK2871899.1 putative pre6S rRNA nuclease [bacterium]